MPLATKASQTTNLHTSTRHTHTHTTWRHFTKLNSFLMQQFDQQTWQILNNLWWWSSAQLFRDHPRRNCQSQQHIELEEVILFLMVNWRRKRTTFSLTISGSNFCIRLCAYALIFNEIKLSFLTNHNQSTYSVAWRHLLNWIVQCACSR